ncbi:hypothetical protein DAEQUDRAFT_737287 [Daedalea quercina L-15889]|uniref:Uncharacterized protein n=1 Tax=Daedalea quercina L-15889 TaxID=1314783 RepID=A0A165RDS9_9APHY|nr:hypothetical protein DAEQUDRAFT_737287 [Daedalea quercina L-15889]
MGRKPLHKTLAQIFATGVKKLPTSTDARRPFRHRKKHKKSTLTSNAATIAEQARRSILKAKYGSHTVDRYYRAIMQQSTESVFTRAPSLWNAYQRGELARMNSELPDDALRLKLADVKNALALEWNSMTKSEKVDATKDYVKDLEVARENKKFVQHNSEKVAHGDGQKTLAKTQVTHQMLAERMGIQTTTFAVRERASQIFVPSVFATTSCLSHFFELAMKTSIEDVTCRLEGIVADHIKHTKDLKAHLVELIREKLDELIKTKKLKPIPRIFYTNFDKNMTLPHQVEIKGWPLKQLCCPSDIKSRTEVELVVRGFVTGMACWRYLDGDEWEVWKDAYFARVAGSTTASITTDEDQASEMTPGAMLSSEPAERQTSGQDTVALATPPITAPATPAPAMVPLSSTAVPEISTNVDANKRPAPSGDLTVEHRVPSKKTCKGKEPYTQWLPYQMGAGEAPVAVKTTTRKPRQWKTKESAPAAAKAKTAAKASKSSVTETSSSVPPTSTLVPVTSPVLLSASAPALNSPMPMPPYIPASARLPVPVPLPVPAQSPVPTPSPVPAPLPVPSYMPSLIPADDAILPSLANSLTPSYVPGFTPDNVAPAGTPSASLPLSVFGSSSSSFPPVFSFPPML